MLWTVTGVSPIRSSIQLIRTSGRPRTLPRRRVGALRMRWRPHLLLEGAAILVFTVVALQIIALLFQLLFFLCLRDGSLVVDGAEDEFGEEDYEGFGHVWWCVCES